MTEVVIRSYRLRQPLDWGDDVADELRKQTRFWNRLVEIDRANRAAYDALMQTDPAVAERVTELKTLTDRQGELFAERKSRRKTARARVDCSDIEAMLSELKPRIAELRKAVKALRAEAKDRLARPRQALEDERRSAVKQAYRESGLWWGNYNAVIASYEVARSRAMKEGAQLNFHRFDGTGRLTNQIQGGMSPADLFAGQHSQVSMRDGRLTATAYANGRQSRRNVTWPVRYDPGYAIPEDTRIKSVAVVMTRIAARSRRKVVFTATREAEAPVPSGPAIAINLGWRRLDDGIRVATVRSSKPIDGLPPYLICPEATVADFARADRIRAERDEQRNMTLSWLVEIDWPMAPEDLASLGAQLRLRPASAAGGIDRLFRLWEGLDWQIAKRERLREFVWADRRAWKVEANVRDRGVYRRLDTYRKCAKALAEQVGTIIIDGFDIAAMARKTGPDGEETDQEKAMRHYRTLAAPGLAREWIIWQARKRGVAVIPFAEPHAHHWRCGQGHVRNNPAALRQYCPSCAEYYDVDDSACRNMLRWWQSRPADASGIVAHKTPEPLETRHSAAGGKIFDE